MQFSDTTNKLGIIQACERYCNTGDTGISGNTVLLKEFTAHSNSIMRRLWHSIFMAYGGWQYDDSNQTNLPSAYTDITASQTSYGLPNGILSVRGVEVIDEDGNWYALKPLTEEQIRDKQAMGEFLDTPGSPLYYQLVGSTIRLFPATDYTYTGGLKVFFDRGSVAFASTDTTKAPGFASEYHDLVPIGASLEWLKIKLPNDATTARLEKDYEILEQRLKEYYSKKFKELFPPRIVAPEQIQNYI